MTTLVQSDSPIIVLVFGFSFFSLTGASSVGADGGSEAGGKDAKEGGGGSGRE